MKGDPQPARRSRERYCLRAERAVLSWRRVIEPRRWSWHCCFACWLGKRLAGRKILHAEAEWPM